MKKNKEFEAWARAYKRAGEGEALLWPSESLVRCLKGSYIPGLNKNYPGKKVLEVSAGNGNNLIFMHSLGLSLSGTEVTPAICKLTAKRLAGLGIETDLRAGTNRKLPFKTGSFDYLVSWFVIHYETNEADMRSAIAEYARVLKPGGRVFVTTTGPDHFILKDAETLGNHRYRIQRKGDMRRGTVHFCFDAPNYARQFFGKSFQDVLIGRVRDEMFTDTLDWFLVTGIKA